MNIKQRSQLTAEQLDHDELAAEITRLHQIIATSAKSIGLKIS